MTNIILFICCALGGFFCGLYLKKRVTQKNALFVDLVKYTVALQLNVSGKQLEMGEFNAKFCDSCSEVFKDALQQKYPALSASQKNAVQEFFANLDCASGDALMKHLALFQKQFESISSETATEAKKSSLYLKLGLLLGAMLGILFL